MYLACRVFETLYLDHVQVFKERATFQMTIFIIFTIANEVSILSARAACYKNLNCCYTCLELLPQGCDVII
jgi:hypothetical protein